MITFETKHLRYSIDEFGNNVEFTQLSTGRNILRAGFNPCGKLVKSETDRTESYPTSASYSAPYLTVGYPNDRSVRILVGIHDEYLTFTLDSVSDEDFWSLAVTLIAVDVDYTADSSFVATLMGMTLNTRMQEYPGRNSLLLSEAYTHIGIDGVKCAVIGTAEPLLNGIMRDVLDEIPDGTMPKAAFSGPYACECPDADSTYTISFGLTTLEGTDKYIEKLRKFGITQINLHQGAAYRQGDFKVNEEYYPNGISDFKAIIDRLHENDIKVMLHSYTFFVQHANVATGNKYVTPKPHKDLGVCARFTLSDDITPDSDRLPTVEDVSGVSTIFGYSIPASSLLWIDDEIIRFAGVDENGFTKITRGVFDTEKTEHKAGAQIKQLNSYFNYIAPEKGSELFYEIARNTAEFYNECGFDGYYLDAIDGVFVLDGNEFSWYHAVDFINELFKYQKKPPIFNCCYGPQYPGQWYARTRMGAFDTPSRGYRDFTDVHVNFNEKFAERMYLVGELGWWSLYPYINDDLGWSHRIMHDEDLDYICSKMLATDVCQCWHCSFENYPSIPKLAGFSDRIKLYTKLKQEKYFDKRIKDIVRRPYSEFELVEADGEYKFRPTFTDYNALENLDDDRGTIKAYDRYKAQKPKIRIEALYTADSYDSEQGKVICDFDETKPLEYNKTYTLGNVSTDGMRGLGVWFCGDGRGETVCLRFKSPDYIAEGNADFFIKVDFAGWRYFSFYELQNCTMKHEDFEPEGLDYKVFTDVDSFYAAYSSSVNYGNLATLNIIVPREGEFDLRLKPIKALPHHETALISPTVKINGQAITFKTDLRSNTFLEYDPEVGETKVYDMSGNLLDTPEVIGDAPTMVEGENIVALTADSDSPYQKRAALTLRTFGETMDNN